jgi:antirestriction protein
MNTTKTVRIAITNLGKYNEGQLVYKWLDLPFTDDELQAALNEIGINEEYEEYFISDYDSEIEGLTIGEYDNIEELNNLIEEYENLDEWDREKVSAIIEAESIALREAIDYIDDVNVYSDIHNDYDLGYYWVNESGTYEIKAMGNLANYIDYESLGRDIRLDESGSYIANGYVTRS